MCTARYIAILLFMLPLPFEAVSQAISLELKVEPRINASRLRNLDFGQIIANSGDKTVFLGDTGMGIFTVSGSSNQQIQVNLSDPGYLNHRNPAVSARIPMDLQAAYNNTGTNDYRRAIPFSGKSTTFKIFSGVSASASNPQFWETAYLYIYGSLEVGDIPEGIYTGTLVLTVEYQ